jgi:hypothetical protein
MGVVFRPLRHGRGRTGALTTPYRSTGRKAEAIELLTPKLCPDNPGTLTIRMNLAYADDVSISLHKARVF